MINYIGTIQSIGFTDIFCTKNRRDVYKRQQITLNKFLLHLPRQCLCGVLVHEYAHFLYPDHGERFWALMRHLDPQNPQTEALLRGYSPHF